MADRLDARAMGLAVLLAAIWGGSYTFIKISLRDLPIFGSLVLRMVLAASVLLAYSRWLRVPVLYEARATWFLLAQTAAFVWSQTLLYLGAAQTTAGRASILFNTQPFFTLLLLPFFVAAERFTARRLAGTALAFAGVVLVFADRLGGAASWRGDALVLLATLGWSANTIMNKTMPAHVHSASVILWNAVGTIPVMAILTALFERDAPWRFTPLAILSLLYLGIVAAGFSFAAFMWLIRKYSAIRVNAFVFLSPVFGVLIGWLALGESLTPPQAAGALAVAAGIYVVNSGT